MLMEIIGFYLILSICVSFGLFIFQYMDDYEWMRYILSPKWLKEYSTMNTFGIIFTTILLLIAIPVYEIVAIIHWLCHIERKKVK